MTNTELNLVQASIDDVDSELEKLDYSASLVTTGQQTVKDLESAILALKANKDGLEAKARTARLTNSLSSLELARCDLEGFESDVDRQSNCVVQCARRAITLLQQIHAALLTVRKAAAESLLEKNFDLRKLHTFANEFAHAAFPVLEITEIGNTLFQHRLPVERTLAINDARAMRSRSEALLMMAENELDEPLNLVDPSAILVVESKSSGAIMFSGSANLVGV